MAREGGENSIFFYKNALNKLLNFKDTPSDSSVT